MDQYDRSDQADGNSQQAKCETNLMHSVMLLHRVEKVPVWRLPHMDRADGNSQPAKYRMYLMHSVMSPARAIANGLPLSSVSSLASSSMFSSIRSASLSLTPAVPQVHTCSCCCRDQGWGLGLDLGSELESPRLNSGVRFHHSQNTKQRYLALNHVYQPVEALHVKRYISMG